MDAEVWGPPYWFVLHTIAFNYPKHPTAIQKKLHYRLMHNLHEFLPGHRELYLRILTKHPVQPYLDSRADFIKWMNIVHNAVNTSLNKPTMTLAEHYAYMKEAHASKDSKAQRFVKAKRYALYVIFIVLIAGAAYSLGGFPSLRGP